jgi:hypothetical protein
MDPVFHKFQSRGNLEIQCWGNGTVLQAFWALSWRERRGLASFPSISRTLSSHLFYEQNLTQLFDINEYLQLALNIRNAVISPISSTNYHLTLRYRWIFTIVPSISRTPSSHLFHQQIVIKLFNIDEYLQLFLFGPLLARSPDISFASCTVAETDNHNTVPIPSFSARNSHRLFHHTLARPVMLDAHWQKRYM